LAQENPLLTCSTGKSHPSQVHYFPIYEEHFGRFCQGKGNLSMAEIGVQSGGSLLMWRHAFGKKLKRLGLISEPGIPKKMRIEQENTGDCVN